MTPAVIRRAVTTRTAVRPRQLIKRDADTLKAGAALLMGFNPSLSSVNSLQQKERPCEGTALLRDGVHGSSPASLLQLMAGL